MTGQIIGTWCGHPVTEIGAQLCDKCESEMSLSQILSHVRGMSFAQLDHLSGMLTDIIEKREKDV